jgi:haloalkane dehalogenase
LESNGPASVEYPFRQQFYTRPDGLKLHYVDEGQGPPVLMVHGNPSWSFLYRRLIADLRGRYRCLAPDHLGMGFSSRPGPGDYGFRLADRAADLAALMEQWQVSEPVHLLVHDWGGPIGLTWAVEHPERVASVTVMNSGVRVPGNYRLPLKLALFKTWARAGSFLAHELNLFVWGTAVFGSVRGLSPAAREGMCAPYAQRADRLAVARFVEDIPLTPGHPSCARLAETDRKLPELLAAKPLTLIWGLRDFVFNRAVFLDWQARFPEAPALALPEAGHYLLEDEPERISAYLARRLDSLTVSH